MKIINQLPELLYVSGGYVHTHTHVQTVKNIDHNFPFVEFMLIYDYWNCTTNEKKNQKKNFVEMYKP